MPKPPKGTGAAPSSKRDPQRNFSKKQKTNVLKKQLGKCAGCKKILSLAKAIGHHIKRWADGGRTSEKNCACVCKPCHDKIHHRWLRLRMRVRASAKPRSHVGHMEDARHRARRDLHQDAAPPVTPASDYPSEYSLR